MQILLGFGLRGARISPLVKMRIMDIDKYKNLFQEVDYRLTEIVEEFSATRAVLQNDQRFIKTRVLLAFSFLEVLCNLYNSYFNLGLANRALIEKWLQKYCLTYRNATYKTHPYMNMLTEAHLYKFRNAITHAFGLPEPENGISIATPNGSESSDSIKKMDEGFKKVGHTVAFISADSLLQLFIDGFTLMHPEIFKDDTQANQAGLEGLGRIVKEFGRRGARGIPLS